LRTPASRCLCGLCLLLAAALAEAAAGTDVLTAFFGDLRTFQAAFEQVVTDDRGKVLERASGQVAIKRPNRFRWDYEQPYRQLLLSDGTWLWNYDPDLQQATRHRLDRALTGTPAMLLARPDSLTDLFDLRALEPNDGLQWIELAPKQEDVRFERVRLGFTGGTLTAMQLVDGFSRITNIRFTRVRRNGTVPDDRFTFTPPPGVDLIGDQTPEH
jgi:outer membrane lipoprotein carrier protein